MTITQQPAPTDAGEFLGKIFSRARRFNRWQYQNFAGYAKGNVLEIGSGAGNLSAWLLQENNPLTLSDSRPENCRLLEKKFEGMVNLQGVIPIDPEDPHFAEKHPELLRQFDTIIAVNPRGPAGDELLFIENCKKLLSHKGRLIFQVPAFRALQNPLDQALGHGHRFSRRQLNELLEAAGLDILRTRYFNSAAIPGWWFFGSVLGRKIIPAGPQRLFNFFVPLWKLLDLFLLYQLGLSLVVIAEYAEES